MADYPLRSADFNVPLTAAQTRVVYPPRGAAALTSDAARAAELETRHRTPRRGALALITGFLLVVAGATVIGLSPEIWRSLVNDTVSLVGAATAPITWQPIHDIGRTPLNSNGAIFGQRAQTLIGAAAVVAGGSVLGAGFFPSLVSSALIAIVCACMMILANINLSPTNLIVLALAVGYLLHAPAGATALRTQGILGTLLVLSAALCAKQGWIRWDGLAERIGGSAPEFFATWGDLCSWGVVLAAIAIGVGIARQRRLRFLNAVVLVVVAWSCIQAGMVKTVHFPTLGDSGKSIDVVDIANVAIWRWVIAGELLLLIWVMLYQARGFGMLNFAFALAWLGCGIAASNHMGTMSAAKEIANSFHGMFAMSPVNGRPGMADTPVTGFDNWGVPNAATPVPQATHIGGLSAESGPLPTPTPEDIRAARVDAIRATTSSPPVATAGAKARQEAIEREIKVREGVIVGWTFLMAIFAGLIGVSGLAWMSRDPIYRRTALAGLWMLTAVFALRLWSWHPRVGQQSWEGWFSDWTFAQYKTQAALFVGLLTTALAGLFALSRNSRASTWRMVSIISIFLGTAMTLGGVAMLINSGGLSPLPTWTYAAIAVGQSWLMWLLLLATTRNPLPPVNRTVAATRGA